MPKWFALALCGTGAVLLAMGVRQSARGRETRHFTRTPGRVVESRVRLLSEADEQRSRRWGFVIRYAYEARGRTLESEQVSRDEARNSRSGLLDPHLFHFRQQPFAFNNIILAFRAGTYKPAPHQTVAGRHVFLQDNFGLPETMSETTHQLRPSLRASSNSTFDLFHFRYLMSSPS